MACFIIAEAGVNHNGELDLARRLIDAAAAAGADAVKFQTFRAEALATVNAAKAGYQKETTGGGGQFDMLRALELSADDHHALTAHCRDRGILFASTPFDEASADLLDDLDVPFLKIPSGDVTNYPLLRHIAAKGRPVILSTGMSTLDEVTRAVGWIGDAPKPDHGLAALTVLHCVTAYPAPPEDLNLACIRTMADAFDVPTGYSDHSLGIEMPIAAAALGATVIEKHFTIDRNLPGPDHRASLEPVELGEMVRAIRNVEMALGDGIKRPAPSEQDNIAVVRRSIVAARDIAVGETLSPDNLAVKRPANGLSPARWEEVVGTPAKRAFRTDEPIEI